MRYYDSNKKKKKIRTTIITIIQQPFDEIGIDYEQNVLSGYLFLVVSAVLSINFSHVWRACNFARPAAVNNNSNARSHGLSIWPRSHKIIENKTT